MIANCKVTALVYFTKRNSQATDQPKSHKVDTEHKLQIYAMEMHSYKATLSELLTKDDIRLIIILQCSKMFDQFGSICIQSVESATLH